MAEIWEIIEARAEAWDEGWNAAVDAAERCNVAGEDFTCGECAICTQGNPYQEADDDHT